MILKYCVDTQDNGDERVDIVIDLATGNIYGELRKYDIYECYVTDRFRNDCVMEYSYETWGGKIVTYKAGIVETDVPEELLYYLSQNDSRLKDVSEMLDQIKDYNEDDIKVFVDLVDNGIDWDTAVCIMKVTGGKPAIIENCPNRRALGKYIWEEYKGEFYGSELDLGKIITKEVIDALEECGIDFYDEYGKRCEYNFERLSPDRYVQLN